MDCRLPGSSVHGIFQARILEWVAISFSRGSSQPRDWTQTQVSHILGKHFTVWATREGHGQLNTMLIFFFSIPSFGFMGFAGGSAGKETACNVGVLGSIPGLERSPGWVRSLGWKRTATYSSILAWRIPWTVQSMGYKESDMTGQLSLLASQSTTDILMNS